MKLNSISPTDILSEDLIDLRQAARAIPRPRGARPLSYQTIWRWANHGVRGHKLETITIGQQRFTSMQRLHAFLHATQGSAIPVERPALTARPADRRNQQEA